MQKITKRPSSSRAAVIVPMEAKLRSLFAARSATISRMSGWPSALHSIGRLQRSINLDSFDDMLQSLMKIFNLTYVTAEVIASMDGTKVDRYQMNRQEVVTYVMSITASLKTFKAEESDIDLIAQLVTSFEANPGAWILQGSSGDDDEGNLHLKMLKLYKSVLLDTEGANLPVYAPHSDSIIKFGDLPQVVAIMKQVSATAKRKKNNVEEESKGTEATLDAMYTLYRYSACRVIDHVYQLLTDKDIWYQFVSPRTKADVMTNLERAKTLRVFSLYCQSLLTYNQFFSIEAFMKSYELVQEWIAHFPSLDESTLRRLEGTIRSHDFLDARADVNELINSFSTSTKEELHALVFPREFLDKFGLVETVDRISERASELTIASEITNMKELDKPQYLPLISGVAASSFDVAQNLAQIILVGRQVSHEIDNAVAGLVPAITRGSAKATVDELRAMNIKCKIPFGIPHAGTWDVEAGTLKGISNNVLLVDSAAPPFSYDYHAYVRDKLRFSLVTDRKISQDYIHFTTPHVPDYDKATELRDILQYQWKTLVPSYTKSADRAYKDIHFMNNPDSIRALVEAISGMNYEIAIREMALPHIRQIWATFLSSFAILYYNASDSLSLKQAVSKVGTAMPANDLVMQTGHGRPYGTTYSNLETHQGILQDDTALVPLGNGLYLRFHKKVPVITDDLKSDPKPFYAEHSLMYFASNSATLDVEEWVYDDGLINFTLVPVSTRQSVPDVRFTPKFVFLTQNLFLNMDLHYKPAAPSKPREAYPLGVVTTEWPYDRHQYFLKYTHFGSYSAPAGEVKIPDEQQQIVDVVKKIETSIKQDVKEGAESAKEAGTAVRDAATTAKNEVKKTADVMSGSGIKDEENPINI